MSSCCHGRQGRLWRAGLTKCQCDREREGRRAGGLSQNVTAEETSEWSENNQKAGFYLNVFKLIFQSGPEIHREAEELMLTNQDDWTCWTQRCLILDLFVLTSLKRQLSFFCWTHWREAELTCDCDLLNLSDHEESSVFMTAAVYVEIIQTSDQFTHLPTCTCG